VIVVEWKSFNEFHKSASDTRTVYAEIALIARTVLVAAGLPRENLYCVGTASEHTSAASRVWSSNLEESPVGIGLHYLTMTIGRIHSNKRDRVLN